MLATDHLLFVHLHKSGGTFVNAFLMRFGVNARRIGYHLPYRQAPPDVRHLPVLGTLRDPLGYYVSWYHFQKNMARPNALFSIVSDAGTLDFKRTIGNLLSLERDERRLVMLEDAVPEDFVSYGLNLTKTCVGQLRGCGSGFYSYLAARMYAGVPHLQLVRTDRIRQDLAAILGRLNAPVEAGAISFLRDVPWLNTSRHGEVTSYYDSELIREIRNRDGLAYDSLNALDDRITG